MILSSQNLTSVLLAIASITAFYSAISLTNDLPEKNQPQDINLIVNNSLVDRCLPKNEGDFALLRLERNADGSPYLACEKHEPVGFGRAVKKPLHIQVAVSKD